ncbi:VOC family protein [Phytomonospora endophytica]|uniref:Putative enzyme related to lactoylglutathione lyase n=1 Tax=Phytomonospora endophytica TaxID=714109 RepID=A0A841FQK8_9ACTN|nr:VOC family protein [Phytomonospora endophytica]MBB6038445.1 putative enzyme related to lactoylglutathione lyase [Phytomonospora endophytica]GIG64374.1 glyoxalase [Phytomonospora endophytica]
MTGTPTQGAKTLLHNVGDLAKAKAVYTALLGVEPTVDSDYYVGYDTAGQHVGLVPAPKDSSPSPVAYWHVDDIEARIAEVTAAGGAVAEAPKKVGEGRLVATVTDPEGNVLGLLQDS